jgi:hypothetical protein
MKSQRLVIAGTLLALGLALSTPSVAASRRHANAGAQPWRDSSQPAEVRVPTSCWRR